MSAPNLTFGQHGPILPPRVAKRQSDASPCIPIPVNTPGSSASSSSTIECDRVFHSVSPSGTIHETIEANSAHAKNFNAALEASLIEASLDKLKSVPAPQRLVCWREAYSRSKRLAFEDSGNLHRDGIAKIIAHIGHLEEYPSESELSNIFSDELYEPLFGSPRTIHEPTEDAICDEIEKLPDAKRKLEYVNRMIPVMPFASIEQQGVLVTILFYALRKIKHSKALSEADRRDVIERTSELEHSRMLHAVNYFLGSVGDAYTLFSAGIDVFTTDEEREALLSDSKKYPQRCRPSNRIISSAHIA